MVVGQQDKRSTTQGAGLLVPTVDVLASTKKRQRVFPPLTQCVYILPPSGTHSINTIFQAQYLFTQGGDTSLIFREK